jgi:drug/metabolite transporter (DMT)-like permease
VFGVAIASITEVRFDTAGLLAALFSTFTFAWMNVLAKKIFEETNLHPVSLLSINSQLATVILFPLWALRDGRDMWLDYTTKHDSHKQVGSGQSK